VEFSERADWFEMRAGRETFCFAPSASTLFREELGLAVTPAGRFRALADARRSRRVWVMTSGAGILALFLLTRLPLQPALLATASTSPAIAEEVLLVEELASVTSITDGDTFRADLADGRNESIRLTGIDAPEPNEPLGDEAAALLHLLISGRSVRLVPDVSDRDAFGRLLRYVYVEAMFVNEAMVESGLAVALRYEPDIAMAEVLEEAQRRAQTTTTDKAVASSSTATTAEPPPTTIATTATTATTASAPSPPTTAATAANCHDSYLGECLIPGIGDYDCAGGSGNGPNYVYSTVQVVGYDEFGLDGDGDGLGCES